ncbi:RNA polymerase sigma-70 factor [Streptomyces griseosporeus]|uniref:RNA polymerase sigma-70 factor n=1 Tax=Streptomyces griseosporeus TaxID=1910 RepID=UPI00167C74DA|nr:RNA polymerase sigma-70 factor [Streptomyces griseosporeus]GHF83896.1 DNA-directed RNA polymerase sigma-70 factor [Streptomyces griseosporeus]
MTTAPADEFEAHRPRLFGLAYRMLGSAHEAEDTVQDAYLRFSGADRTQIEQPGAWLAKVVTNLCLSRLTSARARRESYVGPWLPEPVVTSDGTLGPLESAEQREAVSLALLVLLERLTPTERAVYVLREAFGYGHREIAEVLELGEANCRQLYRRAVQRIESAESRFAPPPERQRELVASFLSAAREGDLAGLEKLLAEDVVWWSDGGGKVSTALRPLMGREKVLRFLAGVTQKYGGAWEMKGAEINGTSGLVVWADGALLGVIEFEYRDERIAHVRIVMNPEKLDFARRQLGRP